MSFLFGPSLQERSHLVQTLRALGPTTIEGLAAALGWSTRRTERILLALLRRGEGGIHFEPGTRRIQVGRPAEAAPAVAPAPPTPVLPASAPPRTGPRAEPPVPSPAAVASPGPTDRTSCPTCRKRMVPTLTGEAIVCPQCGRLALAPRPASSAPVPPNVPDRLATDRRAQELFASYVTSAPILCPRCRSPLRHAGVASFRCPACGETVRIDPPSAERPPLPTVAAAGPR